MSGREPALPQSVELWLSSLSRPTQQTYRRAWKDLLRFTGKTPLEITSEDVARWLDDLTTRRVEGVRRGKRDWARCGYAEATIAQWAAAISSYYTAGELSTHSPRNPVLAVARPKATGYRTATFLTAEEVRAWLRVIPRDTPQGLRNLAVGLVLILTGRRSSEVCRMRWGELLREGERVWWLRSRSTGREAERLPLAVWRAILEYLAAAGRLEDMRPVDFIFVAVSANASRLPSVAAQGAGEQRPLSEREVARLVKRYAQRAGLDPHKVTPTTLRYTAARLRREAGDSVTGISALLGISRASTRSLLRQADEVGQGAWVRVEAMLGL